jgi:hypothetical protein
MKRRLVIEVDCGAKRCKECMYSGDGCELFGAERRCDDKVRPLRLPACLDAERAASRLSEKPFEWPSKNPSWGPIEFAWTGKAKP